MLERILGTVPVEADGSAYLQVPALSNLFFVALDENDLSVKRMQSSVTVQPGETTSCVGCHEPRVRAPHPRWRRRQSRHHRPAESHALQQRAVHLSDSADRRVCHDPAVRGIR